MKIFLIYILLTTCVTAKVGFNQAWFKNNYGTQFIDGYFDENEVERIFSLANDAGAHEIRLWFFEGITHRMIQNQKLNNGFINNVIRTLEIAQKYNLKIYVTLLDAHVYNPFKLHSYTRKYLKSIYNENDYLQNIVVPFFKAISKAKLSSVVSRIDLINEGDTLVHRFAIEGRWKGFRRILCSWREAIHKIEDFQKTPVTISIRLHPLLTYPIDLLDSNGPLMCADELDFHSYHDSGNIHLCKRLKRYQENGGKKLILGEFGQSYFNHEYNDNLHIRNTENYLKNYPECGFDSALAWRLSDIRPGHNKEARYSFEAFGTTRPAFNLIKNFNLTH